MRGADRRQTRLRRAPAANGFSRGGRLWTVTLPDRRQILGLAALAAAFVLVRGPLHAATFALPVSNDDAILLLMGRHVLSGELATILWNQPYNGALDAYLLAPFLALLSHHAAYRLYQVVCAALLVALAGLLARRLGGRK